MHFLYPETLPCAFPIPLFLLSRWMGRACRQLSFLPSTSNALCWRICIVNPIYYHIEVCLSEGFEGDKDNLIFMSCAGIRAGEGSKWRWDEERKNNASRLANGSEAYRLPRFVRSKLLEQQSLLVKCAKGQAGRQAGKGWINHEGSGSGLVGKESAWKVCHE